MHRIYQIGSNAGFNHTAFKDSVSKYAIVSKEKTQRTYQNYPSRFSAIIPYGALCECAAEASRLIGLFYRYDISRAGNQNIVFQ